jgi:hypothetical protein
VFEIDKGQDTNNPHFIARRHLNKGGITEAKRINSVQSQLGNIINQKELDFLTSIKPITIFFNEFSNKYKKNNKTFNLMLRNKFNQYIGNTKQSLAGVYI